LWERTNLNELKRIILIKGEEVVYEDTGFGKGK